MKDIENVLSKFLGEQVKALISGYSGWVIFTSEELAEIKKELEIAANARSPELKKVMGDIGALVKNDPAISEREDRKEILLYPGVKARFFHEAAHSFYQRGKFPQARAISEAAKAMTGIEIHPGATIGERLTIDHGLGIVIGETSIIGNDVVIFHGVTLGGTGKQTGKRHPTIGDNALIGAYSILLGAINVGSNARIGANSTVLHDVPPNTTVAGVLAQIKRYRSI
jgi:serine O-acetyltransferase